MTGIAGDGDGDGDDDDDDDDDDDEDCLLPNSPTALWNRPATKQRFLPNFRHSKPKTRTETNGNQQYTHPKHLRGTIRSEKEQASPSQRT